MPPSTTVLGRPFGRAATAAPLVLRLALGVVMTAHGIGKLQDGPAQAWGGFFDTLGIPAPAAAAWLVTVVELVGGLLLLVGLLTRVAALLLAIDMLGAILLVSMDLGVRTTGEGPGADLNIGLLGCALALVLTGPGRLSLDAALGLDGPGAAHRQPGRLGV